MIPRVINRTRYRMMPPPMRISTSEPFVTGEAASVPVLGQRTEPTLAAPSIYVG
jgi:hypothetical protein